MEKSLQTEFGCTLEIIRTGMLHMPPMEGLRHSGPVKLDAASVVGIAAHPEMVRRGSREDGAVTRMAWVHTGDSIIGLAMVYIRRHFAVGVFDLGEEAVQEMARVALVENRMRVVLVSGRGNLVLLPGLTSECQRILRSAQSIRPASFGNFIQSVSSLSRSFCLAATYDPMGIDPNDLQSLTLSVCMPECGELKLEVRSAGAADDAALH